MNWPTTELKTFWGKKKRRRGKNERVARQLDRQAKARLNMMKRAYSESQALAERMARDPD